MAGRLIDADKLMEVLAEEHKRIMEDPAIEKPSKWRESLSYHRTVGQIKEALAVDSVEYDVLRKWLHEIAINNVNVPVTMDVACEIIIERFDGLRKYASEIGERKEK